MTWVWQDTVDQTRYAVCESGTPEGRCPLGAEPFDGRHMHLLSVLAMPIEGTRLPLPPRGARVATPPRRAGK